MPGFDPTEPRDAIGRWAATMDAAFHGAATDKKFNAQYQPNSELTPEEDKVSRDFYNQIANNFPYYEQQYLKDNGKVVNSDNVKELSPVYRSDRALYADAIHNTAVAFSEQVYSDLLARKPESNLAVFTAGGVGAGKTTSITNAGGEVKTIRDTADVIFDSTLSHKDRAVNEIDQALKTGRKVSIIFTYRDVTDAFLNGVIPRMITEGRSVSIASTVSRHKEALPTMEALTSHYKNNPKVEFRYIDNSLGLGNAKQVPFETIKKKAYLSDAEATKVEANLYDAVKQKRQRGEITEHQYKGLTTKA